MEKEEQTKKPKDEGEKGRGGRPRAGCDVQGNKARRKRGRSN